MVQPSCLLLLVLICHVQAQQSSLPRVDGPPQPPDSVSNFQPSLAVVIGILSIMLSVTFTLLVFAKFCHRGRYDSRENQNHPGIVRSASRFSGIDKTVIESLPFFRFSALRGSREGLECAVCLSKFEDIEILRLLPECKHAFHIHCIDRWLEKHSSCPLCRCKVSFDDPAILTYSNSMRFLFNTSTTPSELREDDKNPNPNVELYVQREEARSGSSRFSIGSSFRKPEMVPDKLSLINAEDAEKLLHKLNHRIIVSDVMLKNRWSNVSSSDLMLLSSELLHDSSSNIFSPKCFSDRFSNFTRTSNVQDHQLVQIKEEMKMKRPFEFKFNSISNLNSDFTKASTSTELNPGASTRRELSEITVFSRFSNPDFKITTNVLSSSSSNQLKEERLRRLWLPIARRTIQWFANREKRSQQTEDSRETSHV